ERSLDRRPRPVRRHAEVALQDWNAPQPVRALVVLATAGLLALAVRRHHLIAPCEGRVVDVAGVVVAIGQQIAAVAQLADQTLGGDSLLVGVQWRDLPSLRQRPRRPDGVQLVAPADAAGAAPEAGVGVLAVAADRQRLG